MSPDKWLRKLKRAAVETCDCERLARAIPRLVFRVEEHLTEAVAANVDEDRGITASRIVSPLTNEIGLLSK